MAEIDVATNGVPRVRNCGAMEVHERLLRTDPRYVRARIASENAHFELTRLGLVNGRPDVTVIPTVVHVVWKTAQENIDEAQIRSQIEVLNKDFRKTNSDIGSIPGAFAALAGDARVQFTLATTDPDGNATNGITRTQTDKGSFTDDEAVKSSATGGADAWPTDRYLNLWVCSLDGGLLGYAQFPGGPAATDGVVIRNTAFGTNGTSAAPFNLGRTATHEIGHWLNLRHIWGDDGGGCNGDDFVADTPNAADANSGKPTFPHVTCSNGPNGDMFMNYMDYTDDDSMFMFTIGQVARMQACLSSDRPTIGVQDPIRPWPVVRRGARDFPVRPLQHLLLARGRQVAVDGIFGPNTEAAVKAFQTASGLASDGVVAAMTWARMIIAVSNGSTGSAVKAVQEVMKVRDPSPEAVKIDGIFGPKTEGFVRGFQQSVGLTADGIVGPITWRAMVSGMPSV